MAVYSVAGGVLFALVEMRLHMTKHKAVKLAVPLKLGARHTEGHHKSVSGDLYEDAVRLGDAAHQGAGADHRLKAEGADFYLGAVAEHGHHGHDAFLNEVQAVEFIGGRLELAPQFQHDVPGFEPPECGWVEMTEKGVAVGSFKHRSLICARTCPGKLDQSMRRQTTIGKARAELLRSTRSEERTIGKESTFSLQMYRTTSVG